MGYHWDTGIAERPAELPRKEAPPMAATVERNRIRWFQRYVPLGWVLALAFVGALGLLFSVGLTLHEAYDAQTAMGAHMAPPPFNSLFESIHAWLAAPKPWMWGGVQNGSLFRPSAWLWGAQNGWLWNLPQFYS